MILARDRIKLPRQTARAATGGAGGWPSESSLRLRYPQSGAAIVQLQTPETRVTAQKLYANLDFLRPEFTGPSDPASSPGVAPLDQKHATGPDPLPQGTDLRSHRTDIQSVDEQVRGVRLRPGNPESNNHFRSLDRAFLERFCFHNCPASRPTFGFGAGSGSQLNCRVTATPRIRNGTTGWLLRVTKVPHSVSRSTTFSTRTRNASVVPGRGMQLKFCPARQMNCGGRNSP